MHGPATNAASGAPVLLGLSVPVAAGGRLPAVVRPDVVRSGARLLVAAACPVVAARPRIEGDVEDVVPAADRWRALGGG